MAIAFTKSRTGLALAMLVGLAACEDFEGLDFLNGAGAEEELSAVTPVAGDVTERDVEAPEIFSANEPGLWDGRPSLGGVWVAYPGIKDPERVIIRNTENDQFVIGALFRRERENPGPKLQMSSDAAQALGMLAGQPAEISVVALRKEEVAPVLNTDTEALDAAAEDGLDADAVLAGVPAAETIDATTLGTVEAATAAIDRADSAAAEVATTDPVAAAPAPTPVAATPAPSAGTLEKAFIQIGIFSVKGNADNTATSLRGAGVLPIVKEQENQGKPFYRVLVGPATNKSERATLLKTVKGLGFTDAYFVTN
jgi:cell division septation protein DedD